MSQASGTGERLKTLLQYLEQDPKNLSLLSDSAETALSAGQEDLAAKLLARYEAIAPLPHRERNLAGLVALRQKDYTRAAEQFERLVETHPNTPALQYNLAWSKAMTGNKQAALEYLDIPTIEALPQAAELRVQLMHDQGEFDEAASLAKRLISLHPGHAGLLAATSVLALDVDDIELARETATRANGHPDALTTLGILSLDRDSSDEANALFDQAIAIRNNAPRAWIGKGLVQLSNGKLTNAATSLHRGAELFGDHVGSWLAVGWAQLLAGDFASAEQTFHHAEKIEHNFSETQGSLAVLMFLTGRADQGRHLAEVARRLDAKSLTGTLAQALAFSSEGKPEVARAVIERAMKSPFTQDGQTLAQAMSRFALGR